jgi:hypothetical protein
VLPLTVVFRIGNDGWRRCQPTDFKNLAVDDLDLRTWKGATASFEQTLPRHASAAGALLDQLTQRGLVLQHALIFSEVGSNSRLNRRN